MLTEYIAAAMKKAEYELMEDGTYFGRIRGFKGVWGNAKTRRECARELQETLEGWIVLGIEEHARLPVVAGISLNGGRSTPRRTHFRSAASRRTPARSARR
jgi:predicted RNase H-like HicB family nuclease